MEVAVTTKDQWWMHQALLSRYGRFDSAYLENMPLYDLPYALMALQQWFDKESCPISRAHEDH